MVKLLLKISKRDAREVSGPTNVMSMYVALETLVNVRGLRIYVLTIQTIFLGLRKTYMAAMDL